MQEMAKVGNSITNIKELFPKQTQKKENYKVEDPLIEKLRKWTLIGLFVLVLGIATIMIIVSVYNKIF